MSTLLAQGFLEDHLLELRRLNQLVNYVEVLDADKLLGETVFPDDRLIEQVAHSDGHKALGVIDKSLLVDDLQNNRRNLKHET